MRKTYASLTTIEHDRPVDPSADSRFLYELKLGLLLALGEMGYLTDRQLRLAMAALGGVG